MKCLINQQEREERLKAQAERNARLLREREERQRKLAERDQEILKQRETSVSRKTQQGEKAVANVKTH